MVRFFEHNWEMIEVNIQTPSDLARLVKNARIRRNLTQQNVADAVGITRQSLARLERGNGGTSFDTVLLILDHLGTHLEAATERRATNSTTAATKDAAQAAANALAKRVTPLIESGALEAFNKQVLDSFRQIDPSTLPNFDASGILEQARANIDAAALASIREASRRLTARLTIPGSVLIDPPQAVEAVSRVASEIEVDADLDAPGSAE